MRELSAKNYGFGCRPRMPAPARRRATSAASVREAFPAINCSPSCRRSPSWAAPRSAPPRARARAPRRRVRAARGAARALTLESGPSDASVRSVVSSVFVRAGRQVLAPLQRDFERLQRTAQVVADLLERHLRDPLRPACVRFAVISSSGVGMVGNSGIRVVPHDLAPASRPGRCRARRSAGR